MSTDDAITKFVKGKIQSSGFSLENQVAKILKKRFDTIRRETSYYDKDEMKGRNSDITARKFFPDEIQFPTETVRTVAQLSLIIECKNVSGNVWVFSPYDDDGFTIPSYSSVKFPEGDPAINVMNTYSMSEIPYVSGYDEYVFEESKSNKKTDNLYSAIMTVTKATSHSQESYDKTYDLLKKLKRSSATYLLLMTFFQPVIVFTGKMFVTKINENEDVELSQVKYVQMGVDYVSKDYNETSGRIHIVTYENLSEYLELVGKHYRVKENFLIKNQTKLLRYFNT